MSFKKILLFLIPVLFLLITFCNRSSKNPQQDENAYLNLHDTVKYVGMETCRSCHAEVYESFIQTGMGKSFGLATKEKTSARFLEKDVVYDSVKNFFYKPLWINDSLFVHEFRTKNGDTVHSRAEYVSYIIGSGQHTNSHICNFSGFLFQAPVTFYTQSSKWDMAPGFEGGFNSRFERKIGMECITCHNGLPEFDKTSENRFTKIPGGIDCERCHGPGEIHVKQKLAGIRVDTSKYIDYTIVNPKNLSKDLQMNLCQRCHLQGVAVLNEGKNFDEFKPGMKLSEIFNVFMPKLESGEHDFIMASQADRLMMSRCYQKSEMTCITCHDPHVSVLQTPLSKFNLACQKCHNAGNSVCSEKTEVRMAAEDNCVKCHMSKSGSIDIPHVMITDHYIRKNTREKITMEKATEIEEFVALHCLTDNKAGAKTMAKGYLAFYEKFSSRKFLLDSAEQYIFHSGVSLGDMAEPLVHLYFLKEDYEKIIGFAEQSGNEFKMEEWTLYRIGEAYFQLGKPDDALMYFQNAVKRRPVNLDFQNKLGATLFNLKRNVEAKSVYDFIVSRQPKQKSALANLGYLYMLEGQYAEAGELLSKAIAIDPDYEMALLNLAVLFVETNDYGNAKKTADRLLEINPENEKAKYLLQKLNVTKQ